MAGLARRDSPEPAEVAIGSQRPEALDAFVRGFNQSAISALMAREARRRKADREFWGWQ